MMWREAIPVSMRVSNNISQRERDVSILRFFFITDVTLVLGVSLGLSRKAYTYSGRSERTIRCAVGKNSLQRYRRGVDARK
jgi:hypothetical protein